MDKFQLFNFENMGEPLASVVNNFINKISSAMGWLVTPKDIKQYALEANKYLIQEIANNNSINPIERAAIINNYKRIIKEYRSQMDILQIALVDLKPDSKPDEVKNDWISFFFDKVKNVTEDDMKLIWGKILAGEFNEPNTFTKQFLHTMSIIDSSLAKRFQKLRSSFFYSPPNLYAFVYRTSYDFGIKNIQRYQDLGIYISDFKELENLGLIQFRYDSFYKLVIKEKKFYYGDKIIKLETNQKSIALGNVSLTNVGKQFCKISPAVYDDEILEICFDSWKKLGYNPVVEPN